MQTLSIKRKPKGLYSAPEKPKETTASAPGQAAAKPAKGAPAKAQTAKSKKTAKARIRKIKRLSEHWPELFNREAPKPLKVGILHDAIADIEARGIQFGTGSFKAALAGYTQSASYLMALSSGGQRYDLTGQPAGEVTTEQQQKATEALNKLKGAADGE
ncbi:ProQ/FINO family protein [Pantoea sp. 1.19]|uniref:ProQ/FINO family protein n=1 Tax=Pantoea sp. 1.19 TaxID=1925589 RepID=UPI0009488F5A|nr:ProQ/FinO family protein [Pantoea sp. 1.19]